MAEEAHLRTAADLRLALGRLVRRARAEDDLPMSQAAVLGYLDREGPMTTSDLAVRHRVRQQSMARTVAQLTEAGYVTSAPHPDDRRKLLLHLTDQGRARLAERRGRRVEWLADAIATRLTPDEQQALSAAVPLLARLADT